MYFYKQLMVYTYHNRVFGFFPSPACGRRKKSQILGNALSEPKPVTQNQRLKFEDKSYDEMNKDINKTDNNNESDLETRNKKARKK